VSGFQVVLASQIEFLAKKAKNSLVLSDSFFSVDHKHRNLKLESLKLFLKKLTFPKGNSSPSFPTASNDSKRTSKLSIKPAFGKKKTHLQMAAEHNAIAYE
jgi:hypothetical protein